MSLRKILAVAAAMPGFALPLAASAQVQRDRWLPLHTVATHHGPVFTLDDGQSVRMHRGTVINPTGTTLQPGMRVTIFGHVTENGRIIADEVDVGWQRASSYRSPGNQTGPYWQNAQNGDW